MLFRSSLGRAFSEIAATGASQNARQRLATDVANNTAPVARPPPTEPIATAHIESTPHGRGQLRERQFQRFNQHGFGASATYFPTSFRRENSQTGSTDLEAKKDSYAPMQEIGKEQANGLAKELAKGLEKGTASGKRLTAMPQ